MASYNPPNTGTTGTGIGSETGSSYTSESKSTTSGTGVTGVTGTTEQTGFVVISGEIGSGKTTLIRRLLNTVSDDVVVGLITNTHPSFGELLQWICLAFDLDHRGKDKVELYQDFLDFLIEQYAAGRRVILVIDEAQDLSPMQARALGRRCRGGSLTVLGDLAQGTSPAAADDWPTLLAHLGAPDATLAVLDRGFRVPAQIIDSPAQLLPDIAPGLARPTSARQAPGAVEATSATPATLPDTVVHACRQAMTGGGSIGVIAAG